MHYLLFMYLIIYEFVLSVTNYWLFDWLFVSYINAVWFFLYRVYVYWCVGSSENDLCILSLSVNRLLNSQFRTRGRFQVMSTPYLPVQRNRIKFNGSVMMSCCASHGCEDVRIGVNVARMSLESAKFELIVRAIYYAVFPSSRCRGTGRGASRQRPSVSGNGCVFPLDVRECGTAHFCFSHATSVHADRVFGLTDPRRARAPYWVFRCQYFDGAH